MPTKKHNIDCCIIASQGIKTAFGNILPLHSDSRLWNVEYRVEDFESYLNDPAQLIVHLCFETETDRDAMLVIMKATQGLFNSCEDGTFIQTTTNDHEFSVKDRTGDWILDKWGVDITGIYSEHFINGESGGKVYGSN